MHIFRGHTTHTDSKGNALMSEVFAMQCMGRGEADCAVMSEVFAMQCTQGDSGRAIMSSVFAMQSASDNRDSKSYSYRY